MYTRRARRVCVSVVHAHNYVLLIRSHAERIWIVRWRLPLKAHFMHLTQIIMHALRLFCIGEISLHSH